MISSCRKSKYKLALIVISAVSACWLGGCGGSQASGISTEEAAQLNHEPRPGGPPPEAKAYMEKANKGPSTSAAPAGVAGAPAAP